MTPRFALFARTLLLLLFVAALVVQIGPRSAGGGTPSAQAAAGSPPNAPPAGAEIPGLRTRTSRTFSAGNGSYRVEAALGSINYKDSNGDWQPIENQLVADDQTGYALRNKANRYRIDLPQRLNGPVRIQQGSDQLTFSLDGATGNATGNDASAVYHDAFPGVDVSYTAENDAVKESITLASAEAKSSFSFTARASGTLAPKQTDSGGIDFVDASGDVRFRLPAPSLTDAAGAVSTATSFDLQPIAGGWTITVTAGRAWLEQPDRGWPVVLDPTVFPRPSSYDEVLSNPDCFIQSTSPSTSSCTGATVDVGTDAAGTRRTLLKFDTTSDMGIPTDSQILYAALRMNLSSTRSSATSIGLYRLTRSFTSAATWNAYNGTNAWTTAGGDYDASVIDTNANVTGAAGTNFWWHLTDLVRNWVEGTTANNGLLLRAASETSGSYTRFVSADGAGGFSATGPTLEVVYKLRTGVLPQYVVDSQPLSDRSSIGVNVTNGNVIAQANDLQLASTGLDLDIGRTYNSLDTGLANIYGVRTGAFGKGWVMNTGPDVGLDVYSNFSGSDGSVAFYGPSGYSVLFPKKPDGTFAAPPTGLDATLVKNADGTYMLTFNAGGRKLTFNASGYLINDEDANGNAITFAYNASNQLTSLTDTRGRIISVSRNSAGLINQLSDPTGRTWTYNYDASNRLITYTDPGTNITRYAYDSANQLTQITDPLGNVTKIIYGQATGVADPWPIISVTRVTDPVAGTGPTTEYEICMDGEPLCPNGNPSSENVPRTYVTDARGNVTTYYTDAAARVIKTTDPLGHVEQMTYTADSDVDTYTSPKNEVTNNDYESDFDLKSTSAPSLSATKTFTYNAQHDVATITDARNKKTTYNYDANGNNTSVIEAGATIETDTYNFAGQVLTSKDGRGTTTTYTYDADGNLASETDPIGNETTFNYDALGRITTRISPRGNVAGADPNLYKTTYTYDATDRRLTETDPLGNVTTYTYDADGNRASVTDARGKKTSYTYDALNRTASVTTADNGLTSYTYDGNGNTLTETNPRGKKTSYAYDADNRLISTTTPRGYRTTYAYDADGNLVKTVSPRGNVSGANPDDYTTTYTYDDVGRLLTETDPLEHTTAHAYNAVGNETSVTDANNHATTSTYDDHNRLTSVTAPGGAVTSYTYDSNDNLKTLTDANGHVTTYTYDGDNRKSSVVRPLGSKWTYAYDADGNLTKVTDANGNSTTASGDGAITSSYDAADRRTAISYSDGTPDVTFAYDAVGNRTQMTDGAGTQTYTYDSMNRLSAVTRGSDTFSYAYNSVGQVNRRTYPDATIVTYTYDDDNRLATAASAGNMTSYTYDADSNLTHTSLPASNGYVEDRTYDNADRLTGVTSTNGGGTTLAGFTNTLDPVGNPTQVVRTGSSPSTTTYSYDSRDRLTSVCFHASCPGASDPYIRWTYDDVGNRLTEARPSGTTTYTYDANDELTQAGSTTYTYDQNGNETAAGSRTFAYDLENRLASTTSGGGSATTYSYDGDGNRLQETTGTQTTNSLWDINNDLPQLALERDGAAGLVARYLYGAWRISMETPAGAFYYHYDPLGSVVNVTDSNGVTQATYSYEPFGAIRTATSIPTAPANSMRFAGERRDGTGLYYLRARQYDPGAGRFLTADPAQSDPGLSTYMYAQDKPELLTDPSGLMVVDPDGGGGGTAPPPPPPPSGTGGGGIPPDPEPSPMPPAPPGTAPTTPAPNKPPVKPCVSTGSTIIIIICSGDGITVPGPIVGPLPRPDRKATGAKATILMAISIAIDSCRKHRDRCNPRSQPTEIHHIVAQTDKRAEVSRDILEAAKIHDGVENRANKVELPYWFHKRLHTNVYYIAVDNEMIQASTWTFHGGFRNPNGVDRRILRRLRRIGNLLQAWSGLYSA